MLFTVIGDSNVRRHINSMSSRDRPMISGAQVSICGRHEVFSEALASVRSESDTCIIACVTNFITSTPASSSVTLRIEPLLLDLLALIQSQVSANPGRHYLLCPPMYRKSPIWYREGLSEVLTKFSSVFRGIEGLHLMSSFPNPVYESDGIHLTPYSGLEFVLHMFDSAQELISNLSKPEELSNRTSEASRLLEDRMLCLEQDHRRLNETCEAKTAADAEMAEFHQNLLMESHLTISGPGLKKQASGLAPRDWQALVKQEVGNLLKVLMGRDVPIVFVQNGSSRRKDASPRYHVHLTSVQESKEIRDLFKEFFKDGKDVRPAPFKGISIRNHVTQETRIRLSILQLIAQRYRDSNPGGQAKVIGFESRPFLKISPPSDSSDARVKSYFYVQAVKSFPTVFSDEDLQPILGMTGSEHRGKLRSLFVVLNDDMLKKSLPHHSKGEGEDQGQVSAPSAPKGASQHKSGSKGSKSKNRSQSQKRGAESSPDGSSSAKK